MIKIFRNSILVGLALLSSSVLAQQAVRDDAMQGKRVLFVVGEAGKIEFDNNDPLIREHLTRLGATVTMATASDSASAASGKDLILISSTVNHRELGNRYREVAVPVVTWSAYSYPLLGMTGDMLHRDFSVVRESVFHNANHANFYAHATSATNPILRAANIQPGMFAPLTFSGGPTDMNWGKPGRGADVAVLFGAEVADAAAVFSYERGSMMVGEAVAPARRVGLFLGDNSWAILSEANGPAAADPKAQAWFAGRRLFDAALRWAVSPPQVAANTSPTKQRDALRQAAHGKKVLYVRRFDLPWPANEASDRAQVEWLRAQGFEVHVADQLEPDSRAEGMDLVIVSASTNKYKLGVKYSDARIPVMLLEAKAVDAANMASRRRNLDYGVNDDKGSDYPAEAYINLMRPHHPIAAGLPAGQLKMFRKPGGMGWSSPPPGAEVIATIPNQPHATIYVFEKGATMAYDAVAPARRALFPIDAPRFPDLTEEGLLMYGATITWLLSPTH